MPSFGVRSNMPPGIFIEPEKSELIDRGFSIGMSTQLVKPKQMTNKVLIFIKHILGKF